MPTLKMDLLEMVIRSGGDVKALNEQNARFDAFEKTFTHVYLMINLHHKISLNHLVFR